jgi:predicted MPP superfamily phosphohydrolase
MEGYNGWARPLDRWYVERITSMRFHRLVLVVLFLAFATNLSATEKTVRRSFSFVVIGHVRGNDDGLTQPLLDPLLAKVREHKPDMIFLTGDMIWGGLGKKHQQAEVITQDWDRLDGALAKLDIPVYRVPGNHDIHDPVTRDIYFARYGKLPQAFSYRGSRFLLLNSSYVPEGTEVQAKKELNRGQQVYLRGKQLDSEQIDFIRKELTGDHQYDHVFVFMHHLLWDHDEEAVWWREVHPLIAGRTVRAVFAGDVGPRKFSHVKRDGIDYIQSSIADIPMENLRRHWMHRMIAQQFDNYLYVTVNGQQVNIEVETVGELSSGHFTPQSWKDMHRPEVPAEKSFLTRVWDFIGSPGSPRRQLVNFVASMMVCFFGGVATTLLWRRRKAA